MHYDIGYIWMCVFCFALHNALLTLKYVDIPLKGELSIKTAFTTVSHCQLIL